MEGILLHRPKSARTSRPPSCTVLYLHLLALRRSLLAVVSLRRSSNEGPIDLDERELMDLIPRQFVTVGRVHVSEGA